jgi:hypothetical protein
MNALCFCGGHTAESVRTATGTLATRPAYLLYTVLGTASTSTYEGKSSESARGRERKGCMLSRSELGRGRRCAENREVIAQPQAGGAPNVPRRTARLSLDLRGRFAC